MTRIGIISDTHGYLDEKVFDYFKDVDLIWHAGDIGTQEVMDKLKAFKPLYAVHGNIDGHELRAEFPENQIIDMEQFIAVKGIKAIGNQLTGDKLKQVNLMESLPFEEPIEVIVEELEVKGETEIENIQTELDDDGQITLSLE